MNEFNCKEIRKMTSAQSLECYLERFIMREQIINCLKMSGVLSDSELEYTAKEFPEIIAYSMRHDSRVALAYIKAGNPLWRDAFPEKVWEDKEVVYQAFCNIRNLPTAVIEKLDESIFERFLNEHTDAEIYRFIKWQRHLPYVAHIYFEKAGVLERIEKNKDLKLIENQKSDRSESLKTQKHVASNSFEDVELSGNIELISEGKNSQTQIASDIFRHADAVYPQSFHYITDLHLTHKIKAKTEKGTPINKAVKQVIANILDMLKITCPESM